MIRTVGVVGAGTMGSGIAQKLAQEGAKVLLVDLDQPKVDAGLARIRSSLDEAVNRKIFDRAKADQALARVEGTPSFEKLRDADLVIEAVFEDLTVKKDVFAKLDAACRPDAILATNTSSFPVADLAKATKVPGRVLGLHFFYHPAKNRLVEVVPHPGTKADAFAEAWTFQERTGKTPIKSDDSPGFVVNRFFVPWLNEAVRLHEAGIAIPTIEAAAKEAFSIGMGPFELMNVTGIPIALHSAETLGQKFGPFYSPAKLLAKQVESKKPWDLQGEVEASKVEEAKDRLLGVVFLVAGEILDEKIARAEDVDLGARVGLRWSKGPLELANQLGAKNAAELAKRVPSGRKLPASLDGKPFDLKKVRLDVEGDLAIVTLDRPDAMNALDESVVAELEARFREAEAKPVKGIVIRGRGKAFIAGADVKWFVKQIEAKDLPRIVEFTRKGQQLLSSFARSRKVVVAAMEGLSLGGGSELALACDYIVATSRATLGFPETGIGIYPGLGGTQRLPRRVGAAVARWMVLTGKTLGAEDAAKAGAFDAVVGPDEVLAKARELVAKGKPGERKAPAKPGLDSSTHEKDIEKARGFKAPIAMKIAEELVSSALDTPLEQGLEKELSRLIEIFSTKDAYEGLSTLGRARPKFVGA